MDPIQTLNGRGRENCCMISFSDDNELQLNRTVMTGGANFVFELHRAGNHMP